jgi:hypothetical protein
LGEKIEVRALLVFLALILSTTAIAQSDAGGFEITPFGAYSFGGTFNDSEGNASLSTNDSASFGLILNFRESANTQWEIFYSLQSTDVTASNVPNVSETLDLDVHYLQAGGTYQGDTGAVRPFLSLTAGVAHFDVKTDGYDSDSFFSFSIGTGLQLRPNERIGFRLEARVFGSLIKSDSALFCVSDPAGGTAGCAFVLAGEVYWQLQTLAGVVFRF